MRWNLRDEWLKKLAFKLCFNIKLCDKLEIYKIINLKYGAMTHKFSLKIARIFFFKVQIRQFRLPMTLFVYIIFRKNPCTCTLLFLCCLIFWEVLNIGWIKYLSTVLFSMAMLYVYTRTCIHSKLRRTYYCLICFSFGVGSL